MTGIDPATVMADHAGHWQSHGSYVCLGGRVYAEAPHCLPYRMAEELADVRQKVADLQAELDRRPVSREQMQAALSRITGPAGRHVRSGEPASSVLGPVLGQPEASGADA